MNSVEPGGRSEGENGITDRSSRERLRVTLSDSGGTVTVAFLGEVDLEDAERIRAVLQQAVDRAQERVTVDLVEVTFLGSTGVRLLLEADARARASGLRLALAVGGGPARRVLQLLQLESRLEIVDAPGWSEGAPRVHIDPQALAESLEGLGSLEAAGAPLEEGLNRVIGATRRLFSVTGAGMMLADDGAALRYVVATDPAGGALGTAQEELGEGPCIDCFVYNRYVSTEDIETDGRWPRLAPIVAREGVRAVLGVPTRLGGTTVGSLNVYRDTPYAWDDSDIGAIESYNGVVETLLASAIAARRSDRVVAQLQEALDRRVIIERAVGVMMGRHELDAVTAFNALRRAARDTRRKIGDVAGEVLAGVDPPAGDPF